MNDLYVDHSLNARLKHSVIKNMVALRKEEKILAELQNSMLDKHVERDENNNYKKVQTNVKGQKSIIFVYKDKEAYEEEVSQVSLQEFEMPEKYFIDDVLESKLNAAEVDTLIRFKLIREDKNNAGSKK